MRAQRNGEINFNHRVWEKGNTGKDATEKVFELSLKDTQRETSR